MGHTGLVRYTVALVGCLSEKYPPQKLLDFGRQVYVIHVLTAFRHTYDSGKNTYNGKKGKTMQFIDLKAQYLALKTDIDQAMQAVLNRSEFIMGSEVAALETEISDYLGIKHTVTCANGTDALQMLYMAYGIGQGDAVFCADITFVASTEPACMLGATPVFCDVEADSFNICPNSLERQIQAVKDEGKLRPRAIIAVDFLGNPADYKALSTIAQKHEILLIEDAAQSFGGMQGDRMCGAFGHSATTSFFPAKPLGCYGDGGAVMTDDDRVADICRSIRVHGKGASKYENVRIGVNSRLDTLQAAVLRVKLKALQEYEINKRQEVAARYNDALSQHFTILNIAEGNRSVYAQYAFLAKDTTQRDDIAERLKVKEIPNMIYYPYPQHVLEIFRDVSSYGETFAVANDYCARTLSLPMHPYLDEKDQDAVIDTVLKVVR